MERKNDVAHMLLCIRKKKPAHGNVVLLTWVSSEDSDEPASLHSLASSQNQPNDRHLYLVRKSCRDQLDNIKSDFEDRHLGRQGDSNRWHI